MTDKEFTDEEIIKANDILDKLVFFNQRAGRELWNEKPVEVQDEDIRNREEDIKFLKDLINRQKADFESLESEFSAMRDTANLYKKENEKWKAKVETRTQEKLALGRIYTQKLKTVKYEAIKEIADKLKEKRWAAKWRAKYVQVVDVDDIDDTLKDMVGEEE